MLSLLSYHKRNSTLLVLGNDMNMLLVSASLNFQNSIWSASWILNVWLVLTFVHLGRVAMAAGGHARALNQYQTKSHIWPSLLLSGGVSVNSNHD